MIPLLVEYSEDEDTGCAIGAVLIAGIVISGLLLLRVAVGRRPPA